MFAKFKAGWSQLRTLIAMQLREKMDLSFLRSKRKTLFRTIYLLIELAGITAAVTVVFSMVKLFGIFSLVHALPVSVIALSFGIMLVFSVIADTMGLMKSLYLSRDNMVLLTFPTTPSLIFLSKLAVYYLYEMRKNFMFTIPFFVAYGIAEGYSLIYYPWVLFLFIFISAIPVLLSALLSIPSMFVYTFIAKTKVLQYLLYVGLYVGVVYGLLFAISLIPENINFIESWGTIYWNIQTFLNNFTEMFAPLYAFTELIVGTPLGLSNDLFHANTLPYLLGTVGVAVALLLLGFLCSKPLFYKMASTPFEFKKRSFLHQKENHVRHPFRSALRKELTIQLRSNALVRLFSILVVGMPASIYLLNKLYAAMNTKFLGNQMTTCFTVVIMLLLLMMCNIDVATCYSRDGSSAYLNKVQPTSYGLLLFSKLVIPMAIGFMGVAFSTVVFSGFSTLPTYENVMLGLGVFFFYVMHLFHSAEMDIMNPQYEQYATFNEQANNPNEHKSGIMAIVIPLVVFVFGLLLSTQGGKAVWTKIALIGFALATFKGITYFSKIKVFYKEKQ